jgi:Helicase associated domain
MPTLVNDLTSQQRSWIFETFGHYGESDELSNGEASSDDLESHYNSKNHEVSTPVRRNSNDSMNYCNDPSPTPYIHIHQSHHPYSNNSNNNTDLPPLSSCDVAPIEKQDNRSSIFRRNAGSSTSITDVDNISPVRDAGGDGRRPSPVSIRNSHNERIVQPHPGSIWSPLNDKVIIATPPTTDHPVFGNSNTTGSNSSHPNFDHSPNISNTNSIPSFNVFPRPPFSRSMQHPLNPAVATGTTMTVRVATTTTTTTIAPSKSSPSPPRQKSHHHSTINEDPNFHLHYPHNVGPTMSHLQPQHYPPHHHPMYAMRPIQHHHHPHHHHHHNLSSAPLGHSKLSMTGEHGHYSRNTMHTTPMHTTPHHSDNIGINKPIVFPHSDDKLTWQQSFENLKIYKRIYGDCNVPQKYKMNVKLGGWVVRRSRNIIVLADSIPHYNLTMIFCFVNFHSILEQATEEEEESIQIWKIDRGTNIGHGRNWFQVDCGKCTRIVVIFSPCYHLCFRGNDLCLHGMCITKKHSRGDWTINVHTDSPLSHCTHSESNLFAINIFCAYKYNITLKRVCIE